MEATDNKTEKRTGKVWGDLIIVKRQGGCRNYKLPMALPFNRKGPCEANSPAHASSSGMNPRPNPY
jgi:hypothetical protein